MFPVINIGTLAIQAPGLILLIGLWIGLYIAEKQAAFSQLTGNHMYNLVLYAILGGLAAARLGYVIQNLSAFTGDPLSLISPNPAMFDLPTGLTFAALIIIIVINRQKLPFWSVMDTLAGLFAIMAVAIATANLASGDAFGMPTQVPWAIELWGEKRHPVQVYHIVLSLFILLFTLPKGWLLRRAIHQPGLRFWVFSALTASSHLFLEGFRADSLFILNSLRSSQVIAWLFLAISLWMIHNLLQKTLHGANANEPAK